MKQIKIIRIEIKCIFLIAAVDVVTLFKRPSLLISFHKTPNRPLPYLSPLSSPTDGVLHMLKADFT